MDYAMPSLTAQREARAHGNAPPHRASAVAASTALHVALLAAACLLVLQRHVPQPAPSLEMTVVPAPTPAPLQPFAPAEVATDAPQIAALAPVSAATSIALARPRAHHALPPAPSPARQAAAPAAAPPAPAPAEPSRNALAALTARIRQAVQNAAVYPPMARMMHREGRAQVRFDYANGAVSAVTIAASSEVPMLDEAAVSAVHHAAVPAPPPEIGPRALTLLVWVDFGLSEAD